MQNMYNSSTIKEYDKTKHIWMLKYILNLLYCGIYKRNTLNVSIQYSKEDLK